MIKLKKFLVSATIVCGCNLLANLNNSTLAMMNNPQFPLNENLNTTNANIVENNPQFSVNENLNATIAAINGDKSQILHNKETILIFSGKLGERDPTRPFCNCEKCKPYDRSKIFYKMHYKTYYKNPMKNLENFKLTAYPKVKNNIIGKLELHDAYIGNIKPPKDNYLILCIPYDLPEGIYDFKIQYDDAKFDYYCNVPLKKSKK